MFNNSISKFFVFLLIATLSLPLQAGKNNSSSIDEYRSRIGDHNHVAQSLKHSHKHVKKFNRRKRPPLTLGQPLNRVRETAAHNNTPTVASKPKFSLAHAQSDPLPARQPSKKSRAAYSQATGWNLCKFGMICLPLVLSVVSGEPAQDLQGAALVNPAKPTDSHPSRLVEVDVTDPAQPTFGTTADLDQPKGQRTEPNNRVTRLMDEAERASLYKKLDQAYRTAESFMDNRVKLLNLFNGYSVLTQEQTEAPYSLIPSERGTMTITFGDLFKHLKEMESWKTTAAPRLKHIPAGSSSGTIVVKQFHYAIGELENTLVTVDLTKCIGLALHNPKTNRGGLGHLAGENIKHLDQYLEGTGTSPHNFQGFVGEVAQGASVGDLKATLISGDSAHISYFQTFLQHLGIRHFKVIYDENWVPARNNQFEKPTGNIALDCRTGVIYGVENVRDIYKIQGYSGFSASGEAFSFTRQEVAKSDLKPTPAPPSSSKPPLNKKKKRNQQRRSSKRQTPQDEL